jgi:hypothetical protein
MISVTAPESLVNPAYGHLYTYQGDKYPLLNGVRVLGRAGESQAQSMVGADGAFREGLSL